MKAVRRAVLAGLVCALGMGAPAAANDYTPSGTIVANSDFTPQANGYSFENYGNENNPKNLGADEMRKLFGGGVCMGGAATGACDLTPAAKMWRDAQNSSMSGGHCEGFAVTASFFYAGVGDPSSPDPLGSSTVPGLASGNGSVQSHIAYGYVFQNLPAVSGSKVNASPAAVLDDLMTALPNKEPVVLGIYKPGFKGGHAITPLAIEDRGNGIFAILVYDNNYPNTTRAVIVDRNAGTWNYKGSTNPAEPADVYEGTADSQTLEVEHVRNGLGVQPCPFGCTGASARGLTGGDEGPAQIIWQGDPADGQAAEVEVIDSEGNKAGLDEDGIVSEIPGVEVVPQKLGGAVPGVSVWDLLAPPQYNVSDKTDLTVRVHEDEGRESPSLIDGVTFTGGEQLYDLTRNYVQQELNNVGGGSGKRGSAAADDDVDLQFGDDSFGYVNRGDKGSNPELSYATVGEDGSAYQVTVEGNGIDGGAELTLDPNLDREVLELDYDGDRRDEGQVKTIVKKIGEDGEVEKGKTKNAKLDGGDNGTISYSDKALRDGKLELK